MRNILAAKLAARKQLAGLPFEEKLALMEQMRDRSLLISQNQLRFTPSIVVSVEGAGLAVRAAQEELSKPPVSRQPQGQSNIPQVSETLYVELGNTPERWYTTRLGELRPESELPLPEESLFHHHQQR